MLVLTRRPELGDHSKISIGHDIELTVVEVRGEQVRLGIDAPKHVSIHRKEIWLQLQAEASGARRRSVSAYPSVRQDAPPRTSTRGGYFRVGGGMKAFIPPPTSRSVSSGSTTGEASPRPTPTLSTGSSSPSRSKR